MKMRNKTWVVSVALVAVCLLGLGGSAARAQDEGSKVDVFVGYSYLNHSVSTAYCGGYIGDCFDPGIHGVTASVVFNMNRHIGIEANLADNNGTNTAWSESQTYSSTDYYTDSLKQQDGVFTYLFGPKVTVPVGSFELWTHFLAGGGHAHTKFTYSEVGTDDGTYSDVTNSFFRGNGFAMEVGGGADWVHGRLGVRMLEVDYLHGNANLTGVCTGYDCTNGSSVYNITTQSSMSDLRVSLGVVVRLGKK